MVGSKVRSVGQYMPFGFVQQPLASDRKPCTKTTAPPFLDWRIHSPRTVLVPIGQPTGLQERLFPEAEVAKLVR